jgi:hypothetical protein
MRDKFGNYVIQRVVDISDESQRKIMIDKILKAAASMKKHKSHARHVFTYLEKHHGINIVYNDSNDADSQSKKISTILIKDLSEIRGLKLQLSEPVFFCCIGSTIKKAGYSRGGGGGGGSGGGGRGYGGGYDDYRGGGPPSSHAYPPHPHAPAGGGGGGGGGYPGGPPGDYDRSYRSSARSRSRSPPARDR